MQEATGDSSRRHVLAPFLLVVALVTGAVILASATPGASVGPPPAQAILSSAVQEEPGIVVGEPSGRRVDFVLSLSEQPVCDASVSNDVITYGFFIDKDLNSATYSSGAPLPSAAAVSPLGVDARLEARCDWSSGDWLMSNGGGIAVWSTDDAGRHVITMSMAADDLPAIRFEWIGFAHISDDAGSTLTRLPDTGLSRQFALTELRGM